MLAARKARETLPVVLQSAEDDDAGVRLAALAALRVLAGQQQGVVLVRLLKAAKGDQEQWQAEQALLGRLRSRPGSLRGSDPVGNG